MSAPTQSASFSRRFVRWTLISIGICLAPILLLAAVAASCLTLSGDAVALREEVMDATGADWSRKVQVSIGRGIIGSAAAGLCFVPDANTRDARLALKAVKHASVGVYERSSSDSEWSRQDLFKKTDRAMTKRGWTRMVGVADGDDTVLIYANTDSADEDEIELCLAVVNGKELVVVSTSVDGASLAALVERHSGEFGDKRVRLAGLKF